MQNVSRHIFQYAQQLAREVRARALLVYADALSQTEQLCQILQTVDYATILVTRSRQTWGAPSSRPHTWVAAPDLPMTRAAQFKSALLICLARGLLEQGDRVVFLGGAENSEVLDTAFLFDVGSLPELFFLEEAVSFAGSVAPEVFERVLTLASQLSVEGREGRPVGTLFVLGDSEKVLAQSRSLVLNPFLGHPESVRNILDPAVEETIKEFAALDGAFVVRDDGIILSAGTQLVPAIPHAQLPGGLGTRHAAAAGITASTGAVAVCISQSTGTVSVFKGGQLVTSLQRSTSGARLLSSAGKPADGVLRHPGVRLRSGLPTEAAPAAQGGRSSRRAR